MPWQTPTLKVVRTQVRDYIRGSLPGADASVPNSVLRVMSDAQGALCHLNLQYLDWLALQLLPDTAESEWLDRHAQIWLVNSDNTTGRKAAAFSTGTASFTGVNGTVVPAFTRLDAAPAGVAGLSFETMVDFTIGGLGTPGAIRALDPGTAGNLEPDTPMSVETSVIGLDDVATVIALTGGTDIETDEDLRLRLLARIRQPPHGGAAHDYAQWALSVPGVTRAWAASEMGVGTVTVRFMMDVLRGPPPDGTDNGGFPLPEDEAAVYAYIDSVRPVTVKDFWVLGPIPHRIDWTIDNLVDDTPAVRANIEASCRDLLLGVSPGQTIFAAWKSSAVLNANGVKSFVLVNTTDDVMPSIGHMGTLGDIVYT